MFKRLKKVIREFDHILLLVGLVFLVASPIWEELIGQGLLWSDVMIIVSLIAGLSVTYTHRKQTVTHEQYFGFIVIMITVLNSFIGFGIQFENITHYAQVLFFLLLTITMFKLIIKAKTVDAEVVINSISGYLLMGLSWAILIGIWIGAFPGSFNFGGTQTNEFFDAMYYAFVTMTTLGYGDMLPVSMAAKSFGMLISVTGAFYTTIVLGMIVGKYISNQNLNK
jgi:hypothetical protein